MIQFLKFALVGVSNVIVCEGLYICFLLLGIHYLPANIIANLLSILNAYIWSNRYVFKKRDDENRVWWKVLAKTYATYASSMLLTAGLLIFWLEIVKLEQYVTWIVIAIGTLGIDLTAQFTAEVLAAGINVFLAIPLNFLLNKHWAYK